jgi:hypothetical protein
MNTEPGNKLERLIGGIARAQPARRAPLSLERRVLSELRRQVLPWWQQNFLYWPLLARVLLMMVGVVVARLCLGVTTWIGGGSRLLASHSTFALPAELGHKMLNVATGTRDLGLVVIHAIPSTWIVVALVVTAVFYATFFGLCAGAYRMLFAQQAIQR